GIDGTWSQVVPLRRGRNDFTVSATDPDTEKNSDKQVQIIINVPYSVVQAPDLTIDSPAEGASFQNGAIPVSGTAKNASQVAVRTGSSGATYVTLNRTSLGNLGPAGIPETWLFSPTGAPKQTLHH